MFDQLMNIVKQFGQQSVVENPEVPNEHNEDVMKEAGNSIFSKLRNMVNEGDADGVSGLLGGKDNHPAVGQVKENFIENLSRKFGINPSSAFNVANSLIPAVLGSLVKRPGNNTGVSLSNILGSIKGENANRNNQGMLSSIGAKLGLDKDGDGDIDLSDLSKMFKR